MTKVRLLLLGVLAAVAVGSVSSSSALALSDSCPQASGFLAICIGGVANDETALPFTGVKEVGSASKLKVALLNNLEVECTGAAATGEETQTVLSVVAALKDVRIDFTGCKIVGALATKCKLSQELIETVELKATIENGAVEAETKNLTFEPQAGTSFATFTVQEVSACPATVLGNKTAKGKVKATLDTCKGQSTTHAVLANVTEASGELTVAGDAAEFVLAETVSLGGGGEWTLQLA